MNIALAFAIFTGIFWLASPLTTVSFSVVQPDSPAASAGIRPGESIVAINGKQFQLLRDGEILVALRQSAGQTISLTVRSADGQPRDVSVTLRQASEIDSNHGALGIGNVVTQIDGTTTNALPTAIGLALQHTTRWMGLIVGGLGDLVGQVAADPTAAPPIEGPIGIASRIGDVFFNAGPIMTLYIAGILSANLAVVNILPFPPLDGGRMLMITLKRIFGARISLRAEQLTYVVGFVFLFGFIIWVTGFDIARAFGAAPPTS